MRRNVERERKGSYRQAVALNTALETEALGDLLPGERAKKGRHGRRRIRFDETSLQSLFSLQSTLEPFTRYD